MSRLRLMFAATVLVAVAVGCKGEEDDTEPAVVPKVVAFEGDVDPMYAGNWASKDGSSTLDMKADGGLKLGVTSNSQNGKSTSSYDGKWLANKGELRLKYKDSSGQDTVLAYAAQLTGNTMVLQQSGGKMKTTYTRKP